MISVIIPTLNAEMYLSECIESITVQTYRNLEIICVDAGSTDGTLDVLTEYAKQDSRIKIYHSPKKSYGYQMNMGIDVAVGDYIGIIEADDVIDKMMYEHLFSYVNDSRPDFVKEGYCQMSTCTGKRMSVSVDVAKPDKMEDRLLELDDGYHMIDLNHIWSAIYRKDFILDNSIRFNETPGASYQDTSFSVLVDLLAKCAVYSSGIHYYYRIDNENSSVKSNDKYKCVMDEFWYINQELQKRKIYGKYEPLVLKHKIDVYYWNYDRLSEKSRMLFVEAAKNELDEMRRKAESFDFEKAFTDKICIMCNNTSKRNQQNMSGYFQAKDILLSGGEIVLVGAGRLGQRVINLHKIYGRGAINAVADNDENKQGKDFYGFQILSINDAVEKYRNSTYCIANKYHSKEIANQIKEKGIDANDIICCENVPSFYEMIQMYQREKYSK